MSENTLVEKIKQEAAATVAEIKAAGEAKVAIIKRETDAAVAALTETKQAALKKQLAHTELVTLAKAKQAGKIAVQTAKRFEVDAIFKEVATEITGLPKADYVSFFTKQAAAVMPQGVTVKRVVAPTARVTETTAVLKELGLTDEVSADARLQAGFIVETEDGVYDITLDRLMSEVRAEVEMEIIRTVMV